MKRICNKCIIVSVIWTTMASLGLAQNGVVENPGDNGLSSSFLIRGGLTTNEQGENVLFSALYSRPVNNRVSVGLGVGYEQAYDLKIIPIFIDLRVFSNSKKLFGGFPGLFIETGYAAVYGDIIDFDGDVRLDPIRESQIQNLPHSIDGGGYSLKFGVALTRRFSNSISYILELGPQFQSIPPGPREINPSFFDFIGPSPGPGVSGGALLFFEDERSTLSSLSLTLGLRF